MKLTFKLAVASLALQIAPPAVAQDSLKERVSQHEAAFAVGLSSMTSPVTVNEMLVCAALWDRWAYALAGNADPRFEAALRPELRSAHAKIRKMHWQREARRTMDEDDDAAYFEEERSDAEAFADKKYAAYVKNDPKGLENLMSWLGECR